MSSIVGSNGSCSARGDGDPVEGASVVLDGEGENDYDTTTDSDGKYYIDCEAGSYTMTVTADGYDEHSESITINEGDNQKNVELTPVTVVTSLEGYVTDKDTDEAIEGAAVSLEGDNNYDGTTDENGQYHIECDPGDYTITITHDDYNEFSLDSYSVDEGSNQYDAELTSKSYLRGYVKEGSGGRSGGAVVPGAVVEFIEDDNYRTTTNQYGYFYIECDPDQYTIKVTHDGYEDYSHLVNVASGENWHNVSMTALDISYGVELYGENNEYTVRAGNVERFSLVVTNTGSQDEVVLFRFQGTAEGWGTLVIDAEDGLTIEAGLSEYIEITVPVPEETPKGDFSVTVVAYLESHESVKDEYVAIIHVMPASDSADDDDDSDGFTIVGALLAVTFVAIMDKKCRKRS